MSEENTGQEPTEEIEATEVVESKDSNSLEDASPEELIKIVKKLRAEAAKKRVANSELEEKAKKWALHEESQKTELEKANDRAAAAEKKALEVYRIAAAKDLGDEEFAEFLQGTSEDEIDASARKLRAKLSNEDDLRAVAGKTRKATDVFLSGRRGTAISDKAMTPEEEANAALSKLMFGGASY